MRIAVVGGGVAGLYAAWHLARHHEVTLLEAGNRIGGHTDTHRIGIDAETGPLEVDTGFIVFNRKHYPRFSAWLDELGVISRESDMSFGVSCRVSGLEYNATSIDRLFCQRSNLLRPRFIGMVRDILRFYQRAPALLETLDEHLTLGDWLDGGGYGEAFAHDHLLPMAAALWSSPDHKIRDFPVLYMLEFMRNHEMLQVANRPIWRTVSGGSRRYVEAALERFTGRVITNCAVRAIRRQPRLLRQSVRQSVRQSSRQSSQQSVRLQLPDGELEVDQVVLACHIDQALALLHRPGAAEREILGAFQYQPNDTVLHTDASRMPRNRKAWASWNVRRDQDAPDRAGITYWMNALQGLPGNTQYFVSLNQTDYIDPACVRVRRAYRHPIYTPESRAAQKRLGEINGADRIWYCGAGWGHGFHEDAVRSAAVVVTGMASRAVAHAA